MATVVAAAVLAAHHLRRAAHHNARMAGITALPTILARLTSRQVANREGTDQNR